MTSTSTDRRHGVNAGQAIKVSCICATTANITLSGEQTIDGITTDGTRVLVKKQTNASENGIYKTANSAWTREPDFDGTYDVTEGTLIPVSRGTTNAATVWRVANTGTITIGTTDLTISAQALDATAILSDGSVSYAADFLPSISQTYDLGSKTYQWVDLVMSGDIVQAEKADHGVTPAAGYGQDWIKSDAPCSKMFTDDAGNDYYLSPPPTVTGHIRAGNVQIVDGDTTLSTFSISSSITESSWESVGPTGSGADNIWADMDNLPSNATILIVDWRIQFDIGASGASASIYAVNGDVSSPSASAINNGIAQFVMDQDADITGNQIAWGRTEIPLGPTNQDLKMYWTCTDEDSVSIVMYYRGFMTD